MPMKNSLNDCDKENGCSIFGNSKYDPLWHYKSLLNVNKVYYCDLQNLVKARSYRNLILSRLPAPNYY